MAARGGRRSDAASWIKRLSEATIWIKRLSEATSWIKRLSDAAISGCDAAGAALTAPARPAAGRKIGRRGGSPGRPPGRPIFSGRRRAAGAPLRQGPPLPAPPRVPDLPARENAAR